MSRIPPLEDLIISKFPELLGRDQRRFYKEFQAMHISCFNKMPREWKTIILGKIDRAPALASKRALEKVLNVFI